MGNKKKQKEARYEHVDYSDLLTHSAKPTTDHNHMKEDKKMSVNTNKQRPTPVVPADATNICAFFKERVEQFLSDAKMTTVDRKMTKELFDLGMMPFQLGEVNETLASLKLYILDRNAQFNYAGQDDKVGTFKRASMYAVVLDEDNVPAYFVDIFVNAKLAAGIRVIPLDNRGPKYINQARWNTAGKD